MTDVIFSGKKNVYVPVNRL